jgi:hypothetical protein
VSSGVATWDRRGGGGAGARDGGDGTRETAGGGGVGGFESAGGAGTREAALGGGGGGREGTFTPVGGGAGLIDGPGCGLREGGAGGRELSRGGREAGFEVDARGGRGLPLPFSAGAFGFLVGGAGGDFELAPMAPCYQGFSNLLSPEKQAHRNKPS